MTMAQQVTNQSPVVGNGSGAVAVADARCLNERFVVAHAVYKTDETVIQKREFFPSKFFDNLSVTGSHGDFSYVKG